MYVHVHVRVHVRVCVHVRVHVRVRVCVHVHVRARACVCLCVCMCFLLAISDECLFFPPAHFRSPFASLTRLHILRHPFAFTHLPAHFTSLFAFSYACSF